VYSIEAHPGTYAKLRRRQLLSRAFNVEPVWAAISDEVGELVISDTDRHIANTVIGATKGRRVPALTLDAFVESRGIERIDFLKMNIEGAERLAVQGMTSSIRIMRNVCIGCHDFLADKYNDETMRTKELVRAFLLDNGFDVVDRRPGDERPWARDYLYATRRDQAQS
jgi:FkbM family methyltransferase